MNFRLSGIVLGIKRKAKVRQGSATLPRFLSLYTKETITTIVCESKILHTAFVNEDGVPQCMPMIGALEDNNAEDLVLFLHGKSPQFMSPSID